DQISIVSYGEEKPLEMGQTEAAYSKNRRAVVVY
ncbi:MAG: peptidoglycan-associated lipoprotein Pal, partial [Vibrio casei]